VKTRIAIVRCLKKKVTVQRIIFHGCLKTARNHVISVQWLNLKLLENAKTGISIVMFGNLTAEVKVVIVHGCLKTARKHAISAQLINLKLLENVPSRKV